MRDSGGYHQPVLLEECIEGLAIKSGGLYVDGTLGGGGHFVAILDRLADNGIAVGLDRDPQALEHAQERIKSRKDQAILVKARFSEVDTILRDHDLRKADGLLLDLGISSRQIDEPSRGFSYTQNASLDMRMDPSDTNSASDLIIASDAEELGRILGDYGEIRNPLRMAEALKDWSKKHGIHTSADLKECLQAEYGKVLENKILAKIFQALRIAVNQELRELRTVLEKSELVLRTGGRLVVMSYHSLEDRMVKRFIAEAERSCICPPELPVCRCEHSPSFKRITRRAVRASEQEIAQNPRSRSARLRIAERLDTESKSR